MMLSYPWEGPVQVMLHWVLNQMRGSKWSEAVICGQLCRHLTTIIICDYAVIVTMFILFRYDCCDSLFSRMSKNIKYITLCCCKNSQCFTRQVHGGLANCMTIKQTNIFHDEKQECISTTCSYNKNFSHTCHVSNSYWRLKVHLTLSWNRTVIGQELFPVLWIWWLYTVLPHIIIASATIWICSSKLQWVRDHPSPFPHVLHWHIHE